jgi:hypothetical protein
MFDPKSFNATVLSLVVLLLALFSAVEALPKLSRRGLPGAVYTCDGNNFAGNCAWSTPTPNCRIASAVSIGPDPGGQCTLYSKFDCTGEVKTIRFPGMGSNLPKYQSFMCKRDDGLKETPASAPNGTGVGALGLPAARLAGGVGSLERKANEKEIMKMEADGFKYGLIGLKKNVYY